MLAPLTTVTTSRKNRKEFKGIQAATISNYNIMEIVRMGCTVLPLGLCLPIQAASIPAMDCRNTSEGNFVKQCLAIVYPVSHVLVPQ